MLEVIVNGEVIPPEARTRVAPKVGFRGSTPGSRECGSVNFTVYPTKMAPARRDLFYRGGSVTIDDKAAGRIFTGIMTTVVKSEYAPVIRITATESMASLSDKKAGLLKIGTIDNPGLEVYTRETTIQRMNHYRLPDNSNHDEMRSVKVFEVRPLSLFGNDEQAANYGYVRERIFDSYDYWVEAQTGGATPGMRAYRSMLWKELWISVFSAAEESIVRNVRNQSQAQLGPEFAVPGISSNAVAVELAVTDEDGHPLYGEFVEEREVRRSTGSSGWGYLIGGAVGGAVEDIGRAILRTDGTYYIPAFTRPRGMFSRTIDGSIYYFYWEVRGETKRGDIHLWQIINHSRAVPLGRIPGSGMILNQALHAEGFGPFLVPVNSQFPWIVAFYRIGGTTEEGSFERSYEILEFDLRQPRSLDPDGEIVHRQLLYTETVSDNAYQYVTLTAVSGYVLSTAAQVLTVSELTLADGRLHFVPNGPDPLLWTGDVFLTKIALDLKSKSLRDVLYEAALAHGADWFINAGGVFRFERLGSTPRTISVRSDYFFENETEYGPVQESQIDSLDGIEISVVHQRRLKEQLRLLMENTGGGVRKRIEIKPDVLRIDLGALLNVNSQSKGRLVAATVQETGVVLYETEPE